MVPYRRQRDNTALQKGEEVWNSSEKGIVARLAVYEGSDFLSNSNHVGGFLSKFHDRKARENLSLTASHDGWVQSGLCSLHTDNQMFFKKIVEKNNS